MAKGNLLLGTAGNSVGDVVMYRREGAQVSRVRVRKIKNPKTDAQSLQRAAFSPVAKLYSPLAVVLERSFEGLSKMKSYNKFLKTNIDLARANGWLLPKGTGFFPLPYKVSNGTLPRIDVNLVSSSVFTIGITPSSMPATTMGELSQLFVAAGYQNGDIVTFIVCRGTIADGFYPVAIQFEIDTTSSVAVNTGLKGMTWDVASSTGSVIGFQIDGDANLAAAAVIVARFENDKWRRSTQFLVVDSTIITTIAADDYKAAAVASYGMNAGDPNPLVYLDGDTLEG